MSEVVKVVVSGGRGPRGFASGALGAGSVEADHITTDSTKRAAIRTALGVVSTVGTGASFVDGKVGTGSGLPRLDFQTARRAPVTGTAGQRHCLDLSIQPNTDDEIAFTGYMPINGVDRQILTFYGALEDHRTDAGSWRPYQSFHGESWRGDYNPLNIYNDNTVEACAGTTGSAVFNLGLTAPDFFRNFQKSYLQGATVIGEHAQSVRSGNILEVNGTAFVGTIDGTTKESTHGLLFGWHAGSTQTLLQSYSFATSTFQYMTINAAETRFGQGHVVPVSNNTLDLGKSGGAWRNLFVVNSPTVTSDARLKRVRGDGAATAEEIAWARSIRFLPYQMLEALAEKGEAARLHWGVLAQDVAAAGRAAGIADPYAYAFLTLDPMFETRTWTEEVEEPEMIEEPVEAKRIELRDGKPVLVPSVEKRIVPKVVRMPVRDEAGNPVTRTVPNPKGPYKNGKERKPITIAVEFDVPQMRKVPVTRSEQVPVLLPEGSEDQAHHVMDDGRLQDVRHGVRYEALFVFLLACGTTT